MLQSTSQYPHSQPEEKVRWPLTPISSILPRSEKRLSR